MRYRELIEGLKILAQTETNKEESFNVCAEHDCIWAGNSEVKVSPEDRATLLKLGWVFDRDVERWLAYV